ncbi:MAG: NUDIX domain-containing protein [Candidatus Peribacteraceae bacterium]|nr:NUDIX domain-containing protein [Candidatus Peribacteraceae bacterium]
MLEDFRNKDESYEIPCPIRKSYIEAIESIVPVDDIEKKDIARAIRWLREVSAVNKQNNSDEHLGILTPVLSPDKSHTFLLQHRKANLWLPPGGHVDLGQTFVESALAEAEEELSMRKPILLSTNPIFLSWTKTQGANAGHIDVTAWFLLAGNPEDSYLVQEKEASDSAWISIQKLLSLPEFSHLHRGFQKIQNLYF